jgi:phosphate transport system substrate-binding protein
MEAKQQHEPRRATQLATTPLVWACGIALVVVGCGKQSPAEGNAQAKPLVEAPVKRSDTFAGAQRAGARPLSNPPPTPPSTPPGDVKEISGAGASFPYPAYSEWASAYKQKTSIQVNYQSIGSGGGIKQVTAGTVDFGASDAPLEPKELQDKGLVQWPMLIGGVVPVINVPGVPKGQLKLTPELIAGLFLGDVKKWNDPRLTAENPGLRLPDQAVTVVHRSDGSGTSWIFTNYLDKVNPAWKRKVGTGQSVAWPTGVGGKGNEGVASYVKRLPGAVGYVEYAYALQNDMNTTELRNRDGNFVAPTAKSFEAAATNAPWQDSPGFYVVLTDQPGKDTWPITGATFILMHASQTNVNEGRAVLGFVDWAYANGDESASKLDYVPIPDSVVKLVEQEWRDKLRGPNNQPIWK